MHIVIFVHPDFLGSQSMPRYAKMLVEGMRKRKHEVEIWTAKSFFYRLPGPAALKKWLGYIDQFVLFPIEVKMKLLKCSSRTLFVFADQALGPWVPLVSRRPFVVHCHDFMAQKSALGKMVQNEVKFSGKLYQKMIRSGYKKGNHFISVSERTRKDLHRFLGAQPKLSEVVYNGLNQDFKPGNVMIVRSVLSSKSGLKLSNGYILHVGGNQFYKNRAGVIRIYNAWRKISDLDLPLILVGSCPDNELKELKKESDFSEAIHFMINISDEDLRLYYQGAFLFLFPSIDEGFGWPIAEALASGCPVVSTGEPPMNEVGGDHAVYIPRMPENEDLVSGWAKYSAKILNDLFEMKQEEREEWIRSGVEFAKRFDPETALENIETIYKEVHLSYKS
ncbi:glycosyltransferase family 4 protein [Gramella lutea]|uniref:Glycosyltransferase family 4 protein n=1 Tax=Christiangramia lutea TaxID=1607951 RepID=A0A9X1V2D2_9FLAO|nr:glycosyltransferase family 1 protein [Christiangramia lutea]MCH4822766.1 glycosyltransferase family 4 protein [Christiangramia lutea]